MLYFFLQSVSGNSCPFQICCNITLFLKKKKTQNFIVLFLRDIVLFLRDCLLWVGTKGSIYYFHNKVCYYRRESQVTLSGCMHSSVVLCLHDTHKYPFFTHKLLRSIALSIPEFCYKRCHLTYSLRIKYINAKDYWSAFWIYSTLCVCVCLFRMN